MLIQLHYKGQCWCDFSTNEVLTRCHGKDECWRGLSVNEVLTWLHVEKASLKKTSANIASVDKVIVILQCKCKSWHSFMTKTSVEHLHKKTSTRNASLPTPEPIRLQRQVVAIALLPS